mmetsp:Transcript_24994/g.70141  ORF Transcript_24994/g.70141 Transcript_24994/m.70141 type:complete len:204 (-) Transcript_24994:199-810(-)
MTELTGNFAATSTIAMQHDNNTNKDTTTATTMMIMTVTPPNDHAQPLITQTQQQTEEMTKATTPTYKEHLKYHRGDDASAATTTSKNKTNRVLSFDEEVEVLPIPMRYEYSNAVRSKIWSSAMEIQHNAARNTVEFAWEGWNWRTVLEDEAMVHCMTTSQRIHPCHYQPYFMQAMHSQTPPMAAAPPPAAATTTGGGGGDGNV